MPFQASWIPDRERLMYLVVKRMADVLLGTLLLVLTSPILLVASVLLLLLDGRPLFFVQVRGGLNGAPFLLIKLRSMSPAAEGTDCNERSRVTKLGKLLRKFSIDELPSLWNVIRGDMSLVGPRPLLMEYLPIFSSTHSKRHDVRPGLTGLAQVSGRNQISWKERLDLDVYYVGNRTTGLDLRIILLTVVTVAGLRGMAREDWNPMPKLHEGYDFES